MAIFSITPSTSVFNNGAGVAAFEGDTVAADTLNVGVGAYLFDDLDPAVLLANTGSWTVNISGSVFSTAADGLNLAAGGIATIKISADGAVGSQQATAIFANGRVNITNAGFIGGSLNSIVLNNTGQNSIVNTGTITSNDTGPAIADLGNNAGLILTNSGEILNSIILGNGIHNITNSGDIIGEVSLGSAIDTVTNSGYIALNVELGGGDNKLTNTASGEIFNVNAGSGNDVVSNAGEIDGLGLGDGNNKFTNAVDGRIDFGVSAGSGNDVISNAGEIDGLNLGDGDNTLTNAASGEIFNVSAGSGRDVVSNAGEIDGLDLGNGNNKLTNAAKGEIFGDVTAGDGKDVVTNAGLITGSFALGDGDNKFTNLATGETSDVTAGSGNDVVTNLHFMGGVDLGDGINKFVNSGRIADGVIAGSGNDTLQNTKLILGDVSLGDGNNTLTNSGELEDNYTCGAGTDIVTNIDAGFVRGWVDLGAGNDTFTGGSRQDQVRDHDGADSYSLKGGNDTYAAIGNTGTDGVDTVNGGAGRDLYDASGATNEVFINLDTVGHTEGPETIEANRAFGLDLSDDATGDVVVDKINNFEDARGGEGQDVIYGSAAANTLFGQGGGDDLFGFGGNDTLLGGNDEDSLSGGAGNDRLIGGSGGDTLIGGTGGDLLWGGDFEGSGDGFLDTFRLTAVTDSGLTKATRDTIFDFEDGVDQIDLSAIDANTTNPGDDAFSTTIGINVSFGGNSGELRAVTVASGWIVEGDVNGDKNADFSIEVADADHSIVWSDADFLL